MDLVFSVLGSGLAVMAAWHAVMLFGTVRQLWSGQGAPLSDAECPPAVAVLCLRGGDPFLARTLSSLLEQDYPDYRVRVVLDSAEDEARAYVDQAVAECSQADRVEVLVLRERYSTCTYKMSGILAATADLPPGAAFVALLDGDTAVHRSWLRELAAPIVRDGAWVATGNRWYAPDHATLPNMVRAWWASSALSLMHLFRIPWGGTMAVRAEVIGDPELRSRLQHAFSEDTTIGQFARERGGAVQLVPSLLIINREDISLRGFFNFDTRQLLTVRMQHASWPLMTLHGLLGAVWVLFPVLRGWWDGELWVRVVFRVVLGLLMLQGLLVDITVRRIAKRRGESLPWWGPMRIVLGVLGLALLPFVHFAAAMRALAARHIVWRGVAYRLGGTPPVQVERDLWADGCEPQAERNSTTLRTASARIA